MHFYPNLGSMDRGLRIIAGLLLFTMGFAGMFESWNLAATLFGSAILLTTIFTFCPLYAILAFSTAAND